MQSSLVVLGNKQKYNSVYGGKPFLLLQKMTIVRNVLATAASQSWSLHHMDVTTEFLYGGMKDDVYETPSCYANLFS